jgi:hypothetical protein
MIQTKKLAAFVWFPPRTDAGATTRSVVAADAGPPHGPPADQG